MDDTEILASWEGWESTTVVGTQRGKTFIASNGRTVYAGRFYVEGGYSHAEALRAPGDALLVGFGTGLFAAGLVQNPKVQSLTIVEIDGAQFNAADYFETRWVMEDPHVEIVVDDALHYLAQTDRMFDIILVDSWGPEASPAIYSKEFHERALKRLRPGGVTWAKYPSKMLTTASLPPLNDAVSCTYPSAILTGGPPNFSGIMGASDTSPPLAGVSIGHEDNKDCDPLSILHPRRIRARPHQFGPTGNH